MGVEHVVRVIDGLAEGTGTDRYGLAPLLGAMLHEDRTFHELTSRSGAAQRFPR